LRRKAAKLLSDDVQLKAMSRVSREAFEDSYTEEINYLKLIKIYESAIAMMQT
jgi:hypothetical protein